MAMTELVAFVRYVLPYPPTLNNLFFNAGSKRVRSAPYKSWRKSAEECILMQGRKRVVGPFSLHVALVRPDKRKRDLTNAAFKAIEDLLVSMGVVEDDSLVQRVSAEWVADGPPCVVIIQPAQEALAA